MTPFRSPASVTPARIHADRAARLVQIEWQDGHRTELDLTALRWLCPCATCRGEGGMPGWLDSGPVLTAQQTTLVDIQLVGSYAIAPTWGDGHATGFYAFTALRDACACPECMARRAAETAAARAAVPGEGAEPADHGQSTHAAHSGGTR